MRDQELSNLVAVPRDLFNDANLLKCLGTLYLRLEELKLEDRLEHWSPLDGFEINRSYTDGSTFVRNILLRGTRGVYTLARPLNSRDPYPLYVEAGVGEMGDWVDIAVFNDDGSLHLDFVEFLKDEDLWR